MRLGRWGGYATWPLVRLSIDSHGVVIGPSTAWLTIFVPTFQFTWSQVSAVEPARGGLRFRLRQRVSPRLRHGPWAWLSPRQDRLTFWYRSRDWPLLASALPSDLWRPDTSRH
jgi:hypothetical protein